MRRALSRIVLAVPMVLALGGCETVVAFFCPVQSSAQVTADGTADQISAQFRAMIVNESGQPLAIRGQDGGPALTLAPGAQTPVSFRLRRRGVVSGDNVIELTDATPSVFSNPAPNGHGMTVEYPTGVVTLRVAFDRCAAPDRAEASGEAGLIRLPPPPPPLLPTRLC
jgi:hypothetical protein